MRAQLRLEIRAGHAGGEGRAPALLVEHRHAAHACERDDEHGLVALGHREMADDARAAAVRDDDRAPPPPQRQQLAHVVAGLRERDAVRHAAYAARA